MVWEIVGVKVVLSANLGIGAVIMLVLQMPREIADDTVFNIGNRSVHCKIGAV